VEALNSSVTTGYFVQLIQIMINKLITDCLLCIV